MYSRRFVLASLPIWLALLAGCSQVAKATSDASIIADGISAILPVVQGMVGVSQGTIAAVQSAVVRVKSAASVLETAVGQPAQMAASELAAGIATVNAATAGLTLPGWVSTALQAAQTLLPLVLSLAGVALGGPSPTDESVANARKTLQFAASQR